MCGLSVEALKRDGINKQSNASMDKSFDGMHEKYDFDSIRFSVKKTISISMIVTSVAKAFISERHNSVDRDASIGITKASLLTIDNMVSDLNE